MLPRDAACSHQRLGAWQPCPSFCHTGWFAAGQLQLVPQGTCTPRNLWVFQAEVGCPSLILSMQAVFSCAPVVDAAPLRRRLLTSTLRGWRSRRQQAAAARCPQLAWRGTGGSTTASRACVLPMRASPATQPTSWACCRRCVHGCTVLAA